VLDWHGNEKFWQLGHVNGLRGFRLMDQKREGLTGFHYRNKDGRLYSKMFFSIFYIPTLNPRLKVEEGRVSSNADWVKKPPKRTLIAEKEVDIFYDLNDPSLKEIFLQKSLGLNMSYHFDEGKISGFALYKPETNLRINAEAYFDPALGEVVVNANPVANHHAVFGAEFEQKFGLDKTGLLGITYIDPNSKLGKDFDSLSIEFNRNSTFESDFFKIEPQYNEELYIHASLIWDRPTFQLSFHGLKYLSDHEKGSDDFYSETVKWKNSLGVGSLYSFNDRHSIAATIRYDISRKDNLLNTEYQYKPWKSTWISVGAEMIKSPQIESYWSAYRANDTGYFNIGHLF
jgi:hypothetical protein